MITFIIFVLMLDKSKYASHGSFIKRLADSGLAKWQKPKLAIIHPFPQSKPRSPALNDQMQAATLQSQTYSAKFKFQSNVDRKPVPQQLVEPFIYIEKIIKKTTVGKQVKPKLEPFVTSSVVRPKTANKTVEIPAGYSNLYQYEEQKRKQAQKLFKKLLEQDIENLKEMHLLWHGKAKKVTPDIDVKESQFVEFMKEIALGKFTDKQLKHFFELYGNKVKEVEKTKAAESSKTISIKALSFNYEKYRKRELETANVISIKAVKERYFKTKEYHITFDQGYHGLKQAMGSIRKYEQTLRSHFERLYESYSNPYADQMAVIEAELQRPIVKYDKHKKEQLNGQLEELSKKNQLNYSQVTQQYERFMDCYERAIVSNHDLFFTKRTVNKLLLPIIHAHPEVTRQLIEEQVGHQQAEKQQYLECLSEFVVEIDKDKKHLAEDCFTLDEIVQMVLMRHKTSMQGHFDDQTAVTSMRKLIEEIKKQFMLKNSLEIDNLNQFPSDQELPLEILHTCFEMQCSKVLLKNQIWTELLNFIPEESEQKSRLHQHTINANVCMDFLKRYFGRLDEKIKLELSKSREISLLAENVTLESFGNYAEVMGSVLERVDGYVEQDEEEEEKDQVKPLTRQKIDFADIVDLSRSQKLKEKAVEKPKENELTAQEKAELAERQRAEAERKEQERVSKQMKQNQENLVRAMLKNIHEPGNHLKGIQLRPNEPNEQLAVSMAYNLADMKTLDKSFFMAENALNTNTLDIRFYEKQKAAENQIKEVECVRLGSSVLLSNLPHVEQIESKDPLKISRFLLSNIDEGVKKQRAIVREKQLDQDVKEGVASNYYREKIKLENKPTVFDSDGRSKYSVLFPVGYYESFIVGENVPDKEKWYLRPHHVETLTENPLSKKDNMLHTEYFSKMDRIPLKKRHDEFVIEANVARKDDLIQSLQERIDSLKKDLAHATHGSRTGGATISTSVLNNYLGRITEDKEDKDLEVAAYEGVLYDLRRKQRELLNQHRANDFESEGEPGKKWWEGKDKNFNNNLRKDRQLVTDSLRERPVHHEFVEKLKNKEIY